MAQKASPKKGETNQMLSDSKYGMFLLFIVIICVAIIPLGLTSTVLFSGHRELLITISMIATPLITFFGIIWLDELFKKVERSLGIIRTAITAAVITEYFVLLALTLFFTGSETQSTLQNQLITSFTSVVGVVIAFYFGSQAYTQGKMIERSRNSIKDLETAQEALEAARITSINKEELKELIAKITALIEIEKKHVP
jgi:hypothetical protein